MIIVMLIVGVLAGVTLSTIDKVRERGLFDETMAEMKRLIKGIIGDEDLISDGKRIDFGYVGDMGKLPDSLGSLIRPEGPLWKGPYYKISFTEDAEGYKKDAWGRFYQYLPEDLTIRSFGNGRVTLTSKIADSLSHLFDNTVFGQVMDRENTPPGDFADRIKIKITYPKNGEMRQDSVRPTPAGSYQFTGIPIGRHRIQLFTPYETLEKYVVVTPNTKVMLDFKLPRTIGGPLIYLGNSSNILSEDSSSIEFKVMNWAKDTVKVFFLRLIDVWDTTAYYNTITADDTTYYSGNRVGEMEDLFFTDTLRFIPQRIVRFTVENFTADSLGSNPLNMYEKRVKIKFSDGSLINFKVGTE